MNRRNAMDLLPALLSSLVVLLLFIIPVLYSIKESLFDYRGTFVGFDNYLNALDDIYFQDAFIYTLRITLISIVITMVSAVILAMAIRKTFIGKRLTLFLLQFDVSMPAVTCASMMLIAFSQTGFTSSLFYNLGLISSYSEFPNIFINPNGHGLILSIVWMFIPYIALSFLAVLHSISNDQEDQAATLGVSKMKRFIYITLPSLKSSIAYTSVLCFACVFGSFELPSLVGREHSLVTLAYYYYSDVPIMMPEHMESYAISIILFIITMVVSSILMYYSLVSSRRNDQ